MAVSSCSTPPAGLCITTTLRRRTLRASLRPICRRFPMPASRPKRTQRIGIGWKLSAPDLDKLVRSIGDALTESGLIRDDARIGMVLASKVETTDWSGAEIKLHRLDEIEVGQ